MKDLSSGNVTPIEYLRVIFRRKWFIIIPAFAGLVLGICAGMLMPPKYQSSTVLLVEEGKSDNPLFNQLAVSTTVSQRLATIKESMLGWNSLVKLVKRLHLDNNIKNQKDFENLILGIRRNTLIRPRGPNVIELIHQGENPEETQAIVKTITEIFIERNVKIQNQETSDAIKFIEEQLKVYRGKIKSAEIAQLQNKLDDLLVDSTEEHPLVKKLRDQINSKKEELKKENLEYTEEAALSQESTSPLVDEIRKALDNIGTSSAKAETQTPLAGDKKSPEQDIYKILLLDKLGDVKARDVKVNEEIYNTLLQRLETAKITQRLQSSKEGTRYTIIDPPRLPISPVKPNKPLIAITGLFLGCAIGVGFIFLREFLDKSFLDVQDAKEYFGHPLLGAISRITTMESVIDERLKERWLLLVTLIVGILAIVISAFLANVIR